MGTFWVLVRQMVQVDVWPLWEEKLSIRTWLRPPTSVVVTRDFELSVAGRPVGRAAAHWLTIDHHTRRPSPLPFPKDRGLFREDGHLSMIRSLWKCSKLTNSVLTRSIFWPKPTIATELISGRPSVEPTITFKGIGPRMTSCSLSLESKVKSHDRNSRQDRTRASGSYWSLW